MYNNPVDFYRLAQEYLVDRGSASGDKTVIQKVENPKPKDPPPSPFSLVELD
jgi:hypothetical protein